MRANRIDLGHSAQSSFASLKLPPVTGRKASKFAGRGPPASYIFALDRDTTFAVSENELAARENRLQPRGYAV
jgi:hypothetical protein